MHRRRVDRDSLLGRKVRAVLEVIVLALLLGLEPQTRQPPQVLLAHRLVHGRAAANALAVVVRDVGPPIGLGLDVAQDHVLDRDWHARDLPGDVGLPAPPRLREMLQDDLALVLLHALGHHVQDVVHHRRAQLQVVVALHALLRHRLCHPLAVPALELPRQQVSEPPLEQRHHPAEEEEPHAPARSPEPDAGTLSDRAGVEAVVDEVLQVLAHADLAHEAVLVAVHARELPDVRERVLQAVGELERVDVAEAELHVGIDDDLGQTQDLAAQMERVAEARLLALLGRQRLDRLQVEVVVQMQVVEVLAMDEEVEHVVALAAHLQPGLDPVDLRRLEELGRAQDLEQVALVQRLGVPVVQPVEHVALEQLLVAHAHLHGVVRRAVLLEPLLHQRHVDAAPRYARPLVERVRRPVQRNPVGRVVRVQRRLLQKRRDLCRELEVVVVGHEVQLCRVRVRRLVARDRVDQRVEVKAGQVGVLRLDVHARREMVHAHVHVSGAGVVEVRESHAVLGADLLADDDLVDVIELVPVLLVHVVVAEERLELGAAGDGQAERLGGVEALHIEKVEIITVRQIRQQLRREAVKRAHDRHVQAPARVGRAVDELGVLQRTMPVVEPLQHRRILVLVQFHLNSLEGLNIEQIVSIVKRRLLIIEGGEAHAAEMATIALLPPHHDPHRAPLRDENRLDDLRDFVHERNSARKMIQHVHVANLLPRHGHILQKLEHSVWHVFQRPEVHALVMAKLLARHVTVILDDLSQVLRREILLLRLNIPKFAFVSIALRLQGLPFSRLLLQNSLLVHRCRLRRGGAGSLLLLSLLHVLRWHHPWRHCPGRVPRRHGSRGIAWGKAGRGWRR
mmetsp:Transcript_61033/g.143984  ORF Transcript_61033/g.143984 Transcript_61033/m.143984 type:complete len:850 (-) Transcript_61033:159-2708(-)